MKIVVIFWNTFRVAAVHSTNLPTFFCHRVAGVVYTVEGVVASTATQLGTAISKYDLTRLSVNTDQDFLEQKLRSQADKNAASQWQVLYLKVIVFFIQTSTLLNGTQRRPRKTNPGYKAAADARTRAISRGFCAGRNTGWAAINVLRVWRAVHCLKTWRVCLFMQML